VKLVDSLAVIEAEVVMATPAAMHAVRQTPRTMGV
jgi:hypothetical protein